VNHRSRTSLLNPAVESVQNRLEQQIYQIRTEINRLLVTTQLAARNRALTKKTVPSGHSLTPPKEIEGHQITSAKVIGRVLTPFIILVRKRSLSLRLFTNQRDIQQNKILQCFLSNQLRKELKTIHHHMIHPLTPQSVVEGLTQILMGNRLALHQHPKEILCQTQASLIHFFLLLPSPT
jgi:hypothetical protein